MPSRPGISSQACTRLLLLLTTAIPQLHSAWASPILHALDDQPENPPGSPAFWYKLVVIVVLVALGGAFAGLTLALMGLDLVNLKVLQSSGSEHERKQATKVLKLLEKGRHWVLCTLLLSNTITNESLPIFLDDILGGGALAIVSSTALILIFGEIAPQSICARYGLKIGAACTPGVLALMYLEFPIAYPIAKLLDYLLGEDEGVTYRRAELSTLVKMHRHLGEETLSHDEVTIISAVLELSDKTISQIMTPIEDIYSLPENQILDDKTVNDILHQGYSRVPIHEAGDKANFIGMLLVKNLVPYDPDDKKPVSSFTLSPLPEAGPAMSCLEALNFFQQGRSHMLLVSNTPGENGGALGVVSLEDVVEEMIGEEIIDETDVFIDVARGIRRLKERDPKQKGPPSITPLLVSRAEKRKASKTHRHPSIEVFGPIVPLYGTVVHADNQSETGEEEVLRAFDKVKLKGGAPPGRRSDIVQAALRMTNNAPTTPPVFANGTHSLSSSPMQHTEEDFDERTALIRRKTTQ